MENRIIVPISLAELLGLVGFDPYQDSPWTGVDALDLDEVMSCTAPNPGRLIGEFAYPQHIHTARVAWLVRNWANDGSDPIDVEVFRAVIVHDGCHRIAAAIARNDGQIYAEVGGDLDEALYYGFPVGSYLDAFPISS